MPSAIRQAFAYRRVSRQGQAQHGHSLEEDQPAVIERLARAHSLRIAGEFVDVQSASTHARPGFLKMLAQVPEQGVDAIVVAFSDRVTRSQSAQERGALTDLLVQHSVTIYASDGIYRLTDPSQILTWEVITSVSAHRLRELSGRLREAHQSRAKRGIWAAGRVPFGLQRVYRSREEAAATKVPVDLVPHETEGEVARMMFTWCAEGVSMNEIARRLNRAGFRGQQGAVFSLTQVRCVLKNPVYIGLLSRTIDGEQALIEANNVKPLIDADMWRRTQAVLAAHSQMHPNQRRGLSALGSLLWCGACGGKLWRYSHDGTDLLWRCKAAKLHAGCTQTWVTEGAVLEQLLPRLRKLLTPAAVTAHLERISEGSEARERERIRLRAELSTLTDMALRHASDALAGLSPAEFDARARPIRERLQQLDTDEAQSQVRPAAMTSRDFGPWWKKLTTAERRQVLHATVRRIVITDRIISALEAW